MTNKTLLLIFFFFVVLYILISQIMMSMASPVFDAPLIQVDTSAITTLEIFPESGPSYALHRTDQSWIVSNGNISIKAQGSQLGSVLSQIDTIHSYRIVSKQSRDLEPYGLDKGRGTRIKIYTRPGRTEEFFIGKTDFDDDLQRSIAYLRLAGQNEIYAVNGFLPFQLERHFNDFRNKELTGPQRLTAIPDSIVYQHLDTQWVLTRQQRGEWRLNDSQPIDSSALTRYWRRLEKMEGRVFVDDFDELSTDRYFNQRLRIYLPNGQDSLLLSCFRDSTRRQPFILHSSHNPRSYFASDSTGLYQSIFEDFRRLIDLARSRERRN